MGTWRALTVGVAVAVVVSGCGGGGDKTSTTSGSSASASTTAANSAASEIRSHLLKSNALAGFHVAGVSVRTTPNGWVASAQLPAAQAAAEKAMLKRNGFRAAVHEDLTNGAAGAASIVVRFGSPKGAADGMDFYVKQAKGAGQYAPFKVTGIPNAKGFSIGGLNGGGINIVFSDGDYYYLVGQEAGSKAAVAKLNAAARQLYQRVHG